MEARDAELINTLASSNDELRIAYEEHTRLAGLVDELEARGHLSVEEEVEQHRLKKLKLAEKDKIMRILDEHRRVNA